MFCYSYPLYSNYYDNFSLTIYIHIGWCQNSHCQKLRYCYHYKNWNFLPSTSPTVSCKKTYHYVIFSLYYIFFISRILYQIAQLNIWNNLQFRTEANKRQVCKWINKNIYYYKMRMITNIFSFVPVLHCTIL